MDVPNQISSDALRISEANRLPTISRSEKMSIASCSKSRTSYGTIDLNKDNKRFWLKTPHADGKVLYAHAASQKDSYMEADSDIENKEALARRNERRIIEYLEGNIDFPPNSESDPVPAYLKHQKVLIGTLFIMLVVNIGCSIVGFLDRRDEI